MVTRTARACAQRGPPRGRGVREQIARRMFSNAGRPPGPHDPGGRRLISGAASASPSTSTGRASCQIEWRMLGGLEVAYTGASVLVTAAAIRTGLAADDCLELPP